MFKKDLKKHIIENKEGKGVLDDIVKENYKSKKKKIMIIFSIFLILIYLSFNILGENEIKEGFYLKGEEVMKIEDGLVEIREFYYNEEGELILGEIKFSEEIKIKNESFEMNEKIFYGNRSGIFSSFEFWNFKGGLDD